MIDLVTAHTLSLGHVDGIEIVGKLLASVGISLLLIGWLYKSAVPLIVPMIVQGIMIIALYFGLTLAFNSYIKSISTPAREAGYYLSIYRTGIIQNNIHDTALFPGPQVSPFEMTPSRRIVLANLPVMLYGSDWQKHQKSLENSLHAVIHKKLQLAYGYYGKYAQLSRGMLAFYHAACNGGLPVCYGDNRESQLIPYVFTSPMGPSSVNNTPYANAAGQLDALYYQTLFKGIPELNIARVRVDAMPLNLTQGKYDLVIHDYGKYVSNQILSVTHDPHVLFSHHMTKIMEATYLPPIAMFLSEISFYLNAALLVNFVFMFVGITWIRGLLSLALIGMLGGYLLIHDGFVQQNHLSAPFAQAHNHDPAVAFAWKVGINNEPLVYRLGKIAGKEMDIDSIFHFFYKVGHNIHKNHVENSNSGNVFRNIAQNALAGAH
jgi:hypothetical protein